MSRASADGALDKCIATQNLCRHQRRGMAQRTMEALESWTCLRTENIKIIIPLKHRNGAIKCIIIDFNNKALWRTLHLQLYEKINRVVKQISLTQNVILKDHLSPWIAAMERQRTSCKLWRKDDCAIKIKSAVWKRKGIGIKRNRNEY